VLGGLEQSINRGAIRGSLHRIRFHKAHGAFRFARQGRAGSYVTTTFPDLKDFVDKSSSRTADGTALESCTIITMPPNPLMAEIHNAKQRMPAILQIADINAWLGGPADEARLIDRL